MIKAQELSQAISSEWEKIAHGLGENRAEFEGQLTTLLRRLDGADHQDQALVIRAVFELFQNFEKARLLLIQAISRITAYLTKGAGSPAGSIKMDRYMAVPVFYGTDRSVERADSGAIYYGSTRGDLTLGLAAVTIPDDHRMGELEKPRLWTLEFREDLAKHVIVLGFKPLLPTEFAASARSALSRGAKNEVLLFVHGYAVEFNDAIARAAQIAYDLHFEGIPVLYSWPSEGSKLLYTVDENNVNWSRPRFAEFLRLLREELGADTIHVIAHSMGNRLVAEAITSMTLPTTTGSAGLRQIVFAAPDIDAETFKDLAKKFHTKAERFTLYASSEDKALLASKALFHKYPRAGASGTSLVVVDTVDTVDASAVDTSLVGHSYYGDNRSVLSDIFELIRRGTGPHERFGLKPRERYGARYWLFSP